MTVHKSALWALVVLVVASSMMMVIAAPVVAQSVDEVRVTPATASSSAGYTVTITTTANLDPGGSVTLTFPDEVVLPDAMDNEYVFIDGQQASVHPVVDGQDVIITVTHQVPPSTFRVLLSQGSGIKNPLIAKKHTDPTVTDPYKIKVATSAEGTIGELAYTIVPRFGLSTKTGDRDTLVYVSGAGWTPNTSVTIGGALSGSGDIQADGTFFIAATPIRSGMVTCIDGAGHGSRGSNGYWDIQASSFTLSAVTPVRTWYVDDDLVEYPAADFTAIQDAVDAAGTDDTVIVYPGTYNENVSVNKEVTIRSYSGAESTFVTAANPNDHVIEVTADGVAIEGFSIHGATGNDYAGIYLNGVDGCAIEDNRCGWNAEHGNRYGIHLYSASDNTIMRNIANENGIGIYMESSSDTILTDNTMINDGIFISGDALEHWNTHTIDSSNMVNGSPVYYLSDEDGGTVPAKAGQVVLANCSNIVIENQKVSGVTMGIALGFSSHNEVRNNSVNDSLVGIYLSNSHDNTLYQNSLSDNNLNIQSEASSNTWSSPEKMAYTYNGNHYVNYLGNYYSDYRGTDDGSGNRVAGDGVGDTDIPYAIDGDGDNYPLMLPAEHYTIVTSRVAEASIAAEIDEDGVVAIPVAITAIEDVITGETISGVAITAYEARVSYNPEGVEMLAVRQGAPPFDDPLSDIDNSQGGTTFTQTTVAGSEPPVSIAKLVPRLTGSAEVSYGLNVYFDVISGSDGEEIRCEESPTLTFQRGDIQGDGDVDMIDALAGIQYLLGLKTVDDIRPLNMASVYHDNGGDIMDFIDCIYIAQHVVGVRDCYFELVP